MKDINTAEFHIKFAATQSLGAFRTLLLICLLCSCGAWAEHQTPDDVNGWGKARWGMSPSQLKKAYPTELREQCDGANSCRYGIDPFTLYGKPFVVAFFFSETRELNEVLVMLDVGPATGKDQTELAEKIDAGLSAKYGKPKILDEGHTDPTIGHLGNIEALGSNRLTLQWVFPSTIIRYSYNIITVPTGSTLSNISITYQSSDLSKL